MRLVGLRKSYPRIVAQRVGHPLDEPVGRAAQAERPESLELHVMDQLVAHVLGMPSARTDHDAERRERVRGRPGQPEARVAALAPAEHRARLCPYGSHGAFDEEDAAPVQPHGFRASHRLVRAYTTAAHDTGEAGQKES